MGKKRSRRKKTATSWWATCIVWSLGIGVVAMAALQVVLVVKWLTGEWQQAAFGIGGVDPAESSAKDPEQEVTNVQEIEPDDPPGNQEKVEPAVVESVPSLRQAVAEEFPSSWSFQTPSWVAVPDASLSAWFEGLDVDLPLFEQRRSAGDDLQQVDLDMLKKTVSNTIQLVKQDRRKRDSILETVGLFGVVDDLLDSHVVQTSVTDKKQRQGPGVLEKEHQEKGQGEEEEEEEKEASSLSAPTKCLEWQKSRARRKWAKENSRHRRLVYSIAATVPSAHKELWERVLSTNLGIKDLSQEEQQDKAPRDRLLILPWTFSSSLLSLEEYALKKLDYNVLFSRLLLSNWASWPFVARRQMLSQSLQAYFSDSKFSCSLDSLGIIPYSAFVSHKPEQCRAIFAKFTDVQEAQVPWFIKSSAHMLCSPPANGQQQQQQQQQQQSSSSTTCLEDEQAPFVVRGLAGLRRQFGRCLAPKTNSPEVFLERAILRPLLVHSRRIKYHALLLVTSATPPWEAYIHRGFISLASPDARTEDGEFPAIGAAVLDTQMLAKESTDLRRQRSQRGGTIAGGTSLPLWTFARFRQYLDSFGFCKQDRCDSLWKRTKAITQTVLEASIFYQGQQGGVDLSSVSSSSGFQVFRMSFWVDEDLNPWFHRGSSQIDFLLEKYQPRAR